MCRGAILWANIRKVYFGCTVADTDGIGFRDQKFFEGTFDIEHETDRAECLEVFREYQSIRDKQSY
jgi:guanine deaminase